MKILFLTQYFPPEVGAPQNRIKGLAKKFLELKNKIFVLTAMPNYPKGKIFSEYKHKIFYIENIEGIKIYRTWIYAKKTKNFFLRLLNYFSFTISSLVFGIFLPKSDIIIVESPPLFLGITGFLLSKIKKAKFVFNISDLWPESAVKLNVLHNKLLIKLAYKLEMFLYKKADLISCQTKGILKNIQQRGIDKEKLILITNGIDTNQLYPMKKDKKWIKKFKITNEFVIGYVGNHGLAQNLETIILAAEILKDFKKIKFIFVGDGPDKERLQNLVKIKKLKNVAMFPIQEKKYIPHILSTMDVCIVCLKNLDLFKGAIPSKMLEYMACGKPILLGVKGEAENILKKAKAGVVFKPENYKDLSKKILYLYNHKNLLKEFGKNANIYVRKNFNRDIIAKRFINRLNNLVEF